MAGVVIGDALGHRTERTTQRFLRQTLGDVLHFRAEVPGSDRELRIVCQQLPVAFELRSTPGSVVDNSIHILLLKSYDIPACQLSGLLARAGMHMQRPTAYLLRWQPERAPIGL